MFCPTCGAENPDGSRFCNQCGATLSAAGASSTAPGGVTRAPTDQGMRSGTSTGDRIELPMVGPSKRTVVAMMLGVGLGCLGIGALAAWKTLGRSSDLPPVTPVGLFGEPTSVTSSEPSADGGLAPANPTGPNNPTRTGHVVARPTGTTPTPARPTTVASNERPAPTGTTPTTPTGNTPSGNTDPAPAEPSTPTGSAPTPTGTTPAEPAPTGTTPTEPAPTGATPAPTGPIAAEPGGVRERVPGTPAGSGFRLGDETDATGHMDPAAFRFVYNHYQSQIANCYSNASRYEAVSGVIVVRVRIGEDGHVRNTRIISDSAHTPALTRCVQTSVQSWAYPRPEGGEVEVDYPMRFGSSR